MGDSLLSGRILLTGATGYVGGRLLEALEEQGRDLRCLARRPEFLRARVASSTSDIGGGSGNIFTIGGGSSASPSRRNTSKRPEAG